MINHAIQCHNQQHLFPPYNPLQYRLLTLFMSISELTRDIQLRPLIRIKINAFLKNTFYR